MDSSESKAPEVIVCGAGLTGAAIGLFLKQRGRRVRVIEKRDDFRTDSSGPSTEFGHLGASTDTTRRSINLALSVRGQSALKALGLLDKVMKHALPMHYRAMHSVNPKEPVRLQPYGTRGEAIYSISRSLLNEVMLNALEDSPGAPTELSFNTKFVRAAKDGSCTIQHMGKDAKPETIKPQLIIGADGAYSAVRASMARLARTDLSQHYIEHGYKELEIPPDASGDFQLQPVDALHIWPRHTFMMIALPNPDRSFTCTLFAPFSTFEELESGTDDAILSFMKREFPDAVPRIPRLASQFRTNPTGALVTMRVKPWNYQDKIVLMGDAAHAVVPFYGQGMNAGLEDTLVFEETLEKWGGDLSQAVVEFARVRQPAGNAIADLSYDNYIEMRSKVASTSFLLRKSVEGFLHRTFPSLWTPLYTMVAFTRTPYQDAITQAKKQDRIIDGVVKGLLVLLGAGVAFAVGPTLVKNVRARL